jgi:hypothetical protein
VKRTQQLKMMFWIHLILLVVTCQLQAATGRRRSQPITIDVRVRPDITSISPQQGTIFGGTAVTTVGTNFSLESIEYVRSYKQSNLSSKEESL